MNYIHKLETACSELLAALERGRVERLELLRHLAMPKYQNPVLVDEDGGERRDWMATGDVRRWLEVFEDAETPSAAAISWARDARARASARRVGARPMAEEAGQVRGGVR